MFSFLIFCKYYRIVTYVTHLLYHGNMPCQGYISTFRSSYSVHFLPVFAIFYNQMLQIYYNSAINVDKWHIFHYSNYSNNYYY